MVGTLKRYQKKLRAAISRAVNEEKKCYLEAKLQLVTQLLVREVLT